MRILLFGEMAECEKISSILKALPVKISHLEIVDDYEKIHECIINSQATAAIVCENGAKGMETVFRIKESNNSVCVLWFSDDKGFAVQSYRLGCTYFCTKPVTSENLKKALTAIAI